MKFLIVDDHFGVRALIRTLVTLPADQVRECASAEEALIIAREFAPDLVLMDVRLRGLDGIAATRALRGTCPSTRVIIVTSYDQSVLREQAAAAGALHFVAKDNLVELQLIISQFATIAPRRAEAPDPAESR